MTLKEYREFLGLTQKEFSEKYNIQIGTLRNWEQGRRDTPKYVLTMAQELMELKRGGIIQQLSNEQLEK